VRLSIELLSVPVWHDCRSGFGEMLRRALLGSPVIAALGPLYHVDPAEAIVAPFARSAVETDWIITSEQLVPLETMERVRALRDSECIRSFDRLKQGGSPLWFEGGSQVVSDLVHWARAGLVLEIAHLRGINVLERGLLHPIWKLRGTATGRFGVEPARGTCPDGTRWTFNPLSLGPDDRIRIRPNGPDRKICVIDFRGMDVCSMISLVPGLSETYAGSTDHHQRTSELTGLSRDDAKLYFLSWAYGASLSRSISDVFDRTFPMVREFIRGMEHGEFPRTVQAVSSLAFRSALSEALPLLVGDDVVPMFTVHDELVIDCNAVGLESVPGLIIALETGASNRIGVPYRVGLSSGQTYDEAKSK